MRASEEKKTPNESIYFLDQALDHSLKLEEARIICELKKGIFVLQSGDKEKTKEILDQVREQIRFKVNLDPLLFSNLYKLSYLYCQQRNQVEEFYTNALQYLAYTKPNDIQEKEKLELSFQMVEALLISPQIYNFSELIE